jgi:hypothetical protein
MGEEEIVEETSLVPYFKLDILPVSFGVVFSRTEFETEMKRLDIHLMDEFWSDPSIGSVSRFENKFGDVFLIVYLDRRELRKCQPHEAIGIIVHETAHVWQYILETIGEEAPGKELEAYCMQYIASTLYQCFKPNRKTL